MFEKALCRLGLNLILFLAATLVFGCNISTRAQTTPQTISKSFDFRNGANGWQAGFADYPPATDNGIYQLVADIRPLPAGLGGGTGFYLQGNNHSDDLFMFLNRRLDASDGVVAGQTYQLTFTLVFGSNAPSGCGGVGGSPGESVALKAGASPAEPLALGPRLLLNVDKSNQSQSGIAASVAGTVANGQPCVSFPGAYISVQKTHQHTSLVNASSNGEMWLLVGTDSGFEGTTALYYQRIDVTLVPVAQQPPMLLAYGTRTSFNTGRASALDSVNMLLDPIQVVSDHNLSADHRTRLNLFACNLELKASEDKTAITVEAEDVQHQIYQVPVEAVNEVPNFNWIFQVTVRLTDEMQGRGELLFRVRLRGAPSNQLPISVN